MIPRVATVLSARSWEPELVAFIRASAALRLVLRAFQPSDIEERLDEIDVIIAGAETSWVTPAAIATWRRRGLKVVGVHPRADRPARALLETGGTDEILPEHAAPEAIVAAARLSTMEMGPGPGLEDSGVLVSVAGSRGAPGRTEVALALAWNLSEHLDVLVIDADLEAPGLAVRLSLPARPDLADAADEARLTGEVTGVQRAGPISVIVGSHRPGAPPLRVSLLEDVIDAALGSFGVVVADLGPSIHEAPLIKRSDAVLLVASADAVGMVRTSRLCEEWAGPPPALILNRVPRKSRVDSVQAARRWLGLEAAAVVLEDSRIGLAARAGGPPAKALLRRLAEVGVT